MAERLGTGSEPADEPYDWVEDPTLTWAERETRFDELEPVEILRTPAPPVLARYDAGGDLWIQRPGQESWQYAFGTARCADLCALDREYGPTTPARIVAGGRWVPNVQPAVAGDGRDGVPDLRHRLRVGGER